MKAVRSLTIRAIAIVAIALLAGAYWHFTTGPAEFDRVAWIKGDTSSNSPRSRMADGLLRSGVLQGKSRAEIEAMLGPPTATDKFESGLAYVLGPERGFIRIDYEWLTLDFDQAGKVRDARIVTD